MQIVFESPRMVAVDKPAGMLTTPGRAGRDDPRPCLGLLLEERLGRRLWPVHRLDAEVSGVVLFALDADAHRAASAWFEGRQVRKEYEALSERGGAEPPAGRVEWRSRLLRGKKRAYESPHGKESVTRARCLGPRGRWLHWKLEPATGRPHQLRVHLAGHGFPIAGDVLYGATGSYPGPGIGLRAVALDFSDCPGRDELGLAERVEVPGLAEPG